MDLSVIIVQRFYYGNKEPLYTAVGDDDLEQALVLADAEEE